MKRKLIIIFILSLMLANCAGVLLAPPILWVSKEIQDRKENLDQYIAKQDEDQMKQDEIDE